MKKNIFYLHFEANWYNKGDVLIMAPKHLVQVLETPHKKWYKQLLQWVTFNWYKAPKYYKCKLL